MLACHAAESNFHSFVSQPGVAISKLIISEKAG
jgi:hypothetical protein